MNQFDPSDEVARRQGIGGGDAYAAANIMTPAMSKWAMSQYKLFGIKLGRIPPDDLSENKTVQWGSWLEGPVLDNINKTTPYQLRRDRTTHWSEEYPFLYAHIDAYLVGQAIDAFGKTYKKVIAEIKCPHYYSKDKYGEEGTDEIPVWTLMQCVHYLVVHPDVEAIFVFVQLPHESIKQYVVKRDKKLLNSYTKAVCRFWSFVEEARKNPKMKGGPVPSTAEDLIIKNWDHDDNFIKLNPQIEIEHKMMLEAKAAEIDAKARAEKHRLNIIKDVGLNPGGFFSDGRKLTLERRETRHYKPKWVEEAYPEEYKKCSKFDKSKFTEKFSPLVDEICEIRKSVQLKVSKQ